MREVFKNVVYPYGLDGNPLINPMYSVSNLGPVVSHLRRCGKEWIIDPNYRKIIQPRVSDTKKKRSHLRVTLRYPIEDWDYSYRLSGKKFLKKDFQVHQLVMWAFRPLEDEPFAPAGYPEKEWAELTIGNKRFQSTYWMIDHCGENCSPFLNIVDLDDRKNDTIEWVTPQENARRATEQYGGNVANASKLLVPQKQIITPSNNLMEFLV